MRKCELDVCEGKRNCRVEERLLFTGPLLHTPRTSRPLGPLLHKVMRGKVGCQVLACLSALDEPCDWFQSFQGPRSHKVAPWHLVPQQMRKSQAEPYGNQYLFRT